MNKKRLIISFFSGIIALNVITISMSIAWYASATRLFVESIVISIDADRELLLATAPDGEYKEHLDQNDVHRVGIFKPLSTSHNDAWVTQKSDTPIFYDETNFSEYEFSNLRRPSNDGFFSQKFYVYSDDDVYVAIDPEKTYIKANEEYNLSYANELYDEYQTKGDDYQKSLSKEDIYARLNALCKAMRYSVLVTDQNYYSYTIIDPNKEEETSLGGLLDNDVDRYYDYYKKESDNSYYERVYGQIIGDKANIVYDEPSTVDSDFERANEEPSAFNAKHKAGVKRFNLEQTLANGVDFVKEQSYSLDDLRSKPNPYHFPVYRESPQEIVISIYIEGWDLDSVNYTMGAGFISNLAFKIEREM